MRLFYFNPEHDDALVPYSPYYLAKETARKIRHDLSFLPLWLMKEDDWLWSESPLSDKWFSDVINLFPECHILLKEDALREKSFKSVEPWGWDVTARHYFRKNACNVQLPTDETLAKIRSLSHRSVAVRFLNKLKSQKSSLVGEAFVCSSLEDVKKKVVSYPETLLKMPWSGSGRGLWRAHGIFKEPLIGWCRNIIKRQDAVIVEPFYESKECDFAMEFFLKNGDVSFLGYSLFYTDEKGAYNRNVVASQELLCKRLLHYFSEAFLKRLEQLLLQSLKSEIAPVYEGPLGVDMMVLRSIDGTFYCHPCVEINLRYTMGMVAISLAQYIPGDCKASFSILFHNEKGALYESLMKRIELNPPVFMDHKLYKGCFSLVPLTKDCQFHALLEL